MLSSQKFEIFNAFLSKFGIKIVLIYMVKNGMSVVVGYFSPCTLLSFHMNSS